ncbi:MAG: hypothetical protein Q9176_005984 [Flavoplaca citrina]
MDFAIEPPPAGGDKNRGSIILALDGVIFGISWSMVLLRLGTRSWITRNLGWDDTTIFLAALTNSVGLAFYLCMVLYGLGRHKYYLSHYDLKMFLKWDYLDWVQAILTLAISKISICLLLLRLSQFSKLKKGLYWLIAFIFVTHLPLIVLLIVQCRPVEKTWNTIVDGKCFSKNMIANILIAQGVFSILTDFIGAAFPILLLWNVKIKFGSKVAIWLLMGFGIVTSITCIVRTSLTYQIKSRDLSWDAVGISIAKMLEVNFGIIAACLPIMKPLYAYLRSLYTGIPLERHRRRSNQTHSNFSSSRSHRAWYRLRSSRSLILPRRASKHKGNDTIVGANGGGVGTKGQGSTELGRQYTWRHPLPEMSWRGFGKDKGDSEVELPMQGIDKRVDFSVDAGSVGASRDEGKKVALDEIL